MEDNLSALIKYMYSSCRKPEPTSMDSISDNNGAYNNPNRERLWKILQKEGLERETVNLMRDVYKNNKVIVTWGAQTTKQAAIRRGLLQGWPFHPGS